LSGRWHESGESRRYESNETARSAVMEHRDQDQDLYSVLLNDRYSVEDLSRLLDIDRKRIEQAVFRGELAAKVVNHQIIDIARSDAIAWLSAGGAMVTE
jgi:hypothetical protein